MRQKYHVSIKEAAKLLNKEKNKFVEVITNGKMTVEYFAPKKIDDNSHIKRMNCILLLQVIQIFTEMKR